MNKKRIAGKELMARVRAGFIANGMSLHAWCIQNNVNYPNARQALIGSWAGVKGTKLLNQIADAAGLEK